jgi:hypothetical protein
LALQRWVKNQGGIGGLSALNFLFSNMPKVLIILSDAHAFPLKKSDGTVVEEETGFFLMELAKPLAKILDAGYEVTVRVPSSPHYNRSVLIIVILDSLRHQKASVRMSIRSRHRRHLHSSGTGTRRTEFVTSFSNPQGSHISSIHLWVSCTGKRADQEDGARKQPSFTSSIQVHRGRRTQHL